MRRLTSSIVLAVAFCIPFLIWGDQFIQWLTGDAAIQWIRGWGAWGWLAVIGLLVSDLILPIPATPVMSAAGYLYGTLIGRLVSAAGSFAAGMAGYGLSRTFGRNIAVRLAGEKELAEHDTLFERSGPWLGAASRWLPLLPEVISCLAGLMRMPLRVFAVSLACGSIPMGFVYAAIGAVGQDNPKLALTISATVNGVGDFLSSLVAGLLWSAFGPATAFAYSAVLFTLGALLAAGLGNKSAPPTILA